MLGNSVRFHLTVQPILDRDADQAINRTFPTNSSLVTGPNSSYRLSKLFPKSSPTTKYSPGFIVTVPHIGQASGDGPFHNGFPHATGGSNAVPFTSTGPSRPVVSTFPA